MKHDDFVMIGQVCGINGKGELRVRLQFAARFLEGVSEFFVSSGKRISSVCSRISFGILFLKVEFDAKEMIKKFYKDSIFVRKNDLTLGNHEYFVSDLLNFNVIDADSGRKYGFLEKIFNTNANDVYEIKSAEGGKYLLPAISEMVVNVDSRNKLILIRPIEGFFCD
ncbi:MAG: PRC-barrel domain-containing protein [Oscillospiraceae bacterium]|jgi:16S rRNA processing protein RimM|nr:PRC-barrel domain-containing protein [Oscillospiraceae bacterium]